MDTNKWAAPGDLGLEGLCLGDVGDGHDDFFGPSPAATDLELLATAPPPPPPHAAALAGAPPRPEAEPGGAARPSGGEHAPEQAK